MDLSNSNLLDNDVIQPDNQYSNFTFKDLFQKNTIKAGLFGGPAAAIAAANKADKAKAAALAAQNAAIEQQKNVEIAQAQTELNKAKAELDAVKNAPITSSTNYSNNLLREDAGDTGKILGIPKVGFWVGVSVLGAGAVALTIYLIRRK